MEEIQELKPDPFFREVRFLSSYADASKVPSKGIPHIAFAGRSNSGKSRLLNAIVERKSLAKVSASPGKTKLLNFFLVSKSLFLVDTPGFGYSSNSHKEHEQMMTLLMNYLNSAKDLKCLFLLSDAQRELPEEELELIGTCFEKGTKPVLVRTKIDKLNQSELSKLRKKMKSIQGLYPMLEIVLVSPKYGKGLPELRKIIETMMKTIVVPPVEEDSISEEVHEQA